MRYHHVCLEAVTHVLPPHVVTSEQIETELAPVYERLGLPAGRLELMSGIRERRFFDPGVQPGDVSAQTAKLAIERSGLDPELFGCLIHGSVCRDQLEPATACKVHHAAGLSPRAMMLDVSNACLGLLNGMMLIANMIELGQIRAGIVVGTESGRDLVEGTIHSLLNAPTLKRQDVKGDFASLTIGSGSAAFVLCHADLSQSKMRLRGGIALADSASHKLCEGGSTTHRTDDNRPRMQTDAEALLNAGINLAAKTWGRFLDEVGWRKEDVTKAFTHQVGRAHRKMLYDRLELNPAIDFPTVEFLGNTGAVALPMAMSLGIEAGHAKPGDRMALLGIGSGLNCLMLGVDWDAAREQ
ncbi:MAG: 3-oxoacyl-ACP synthase III [Planctomycetales bacterium]